MKRDRLYTVNKGNKAQFARDVDRVNQNIFAFGDSMHTPDPIFNTPGQYISGTQNASQWVLANSPQLDLGGMPAGVKYNSTYNNARLSKDSVSPWQYKEVPENNSKSFDFKGTLGTVATAVPDSVYDDLDPLYHIADGKHSKWGDTLGTTGVNVFKAGAASGNGPVMLAGAILKSTGDVVNIGWGMKRNEEAINHLKQNNAGMRTAGNALASSNTNDEVIANAGSMRGLTGYTPHGLVKGGIFKKGAAHREGMGYLNTERAADAVQTHGLLTGIKKADRTVDDIAQINSAAYGGLFDTLMGSNMDATTYGLLSDYLTTKREQNATKNKMPGIAPVSLLRNGGEIHIKKANRGKFTEQANRAGMGVQEYAAHVLANKEDYPTSTIMRANFARNFGGRHAFGGPLDDTLFALGGDIQTHGSDWSTGMSHIDAGRSHEENPNDGVQVGVDPEGKPNLVEEGEVIFNDYVYSNRISLDEEAKKKFHISKKREITYADMAKKLEAEISERPNDPISKAGFKEQMEDLAEEQERQKADMQAEEAREAFNALSPEEQVALMQEAQGQQEENDQAQQKAMMQEQAMQEQAMAEQQGVQIPEEEVMAQQQALQGDGSIANLGTQPQMAACGGHLYSDGGILNLLHLLGYKDTAEAEKAGWKPSDFGEYKTWNDIKSDSELSDDFKWTDAFSKRVTSPTQKAALSLGWNPLAKKLETTWYENPNRNAVGWTQSVRKKTLNAKEFKEYAERYPNTLGWAIKEGKIKAPSGNGTISMEEVAKAMSEAPDWKATDEWLYSDIANQAKYLGMARGLNPNDDKKFVERWSPYGTFAQDGESNWTYTLNPNLSDEQKKAFTEQFKNTRGDNKIGVMYNSMHSPGEVVNRYVLDNDGIPRLITDKDLAGYKELSRYTWGDEPNDTNTTAIFYNPKTPGRIYHAVEGDEDFLPDSTDLSTLGNETRRVTTPDGDTVIYHASNDIPTDTAMGNLPERAAVGTVTSGDEPVKFKHTYFGLGDMGPLVGLGMQAAGVGKPNLRGLEAALSAVTNTSPSTVNYKPIGNYLRYDPMDIWAEQNKMNATSRGTARAIQNNSGPIGTQTAGLLAASLNDQQASGDLYRKALEYNNALNNNVANFNRATDQFNAEAFNRASMANAEIRNRDRQLRAQLGLQTEMEKLNTRANWYKGIYGNIDNFFQGLGAHEKENRTGDMIAWMINNGVISPLNTRGLKDIGYTTKPAKSANGGSIKRKKRRGGLTY